MEKYDVAIIGAGVGGLVCGCYLAKAGLNVAIFEQQSKPGGYCTSFERQGYRFDVGVHYLGGIKNSNFGKILEELDIKDEIKFNQFDPTDKIVMPDSVIYVRKESNDTVEEFKKSFPKENSNIDRFFKFVTQEDFRSLYKKTEKLTFKELIDSFFKDVKIKATFEVLLSNLGLPASQFSAASAILLYRDYILDGGYYPENGMQGVADALAHKFQKYKGKLFLNKRVEKILQENSNATGLSFVDRMEARANFIISNADATQTFKKLLNGYRCKEKALVDKLLISPSIFAVYLGVDNNLDLSTNETCNIWNFDTYDVAKCLTNLDNNILQPDLSYIMISFPSAHDSFHEINNKNTIQCFILSHFASESFWKKHKEELADKMVKKAAKILPNLEKNVKIRIIATPQTFYKYTSNREGSACGWSSTVTQLKPNTFPQKTSIDNLFLVGHWCTIGVGQGGVPKVAFSGKRGSELILRKIKYA